MISTAQAAKILHYSHTSRVRERFNRAELDGERYSGMILIDENSPKFIALKKFRDEKIKYRKNLGK